MLAWLSFLFTLWGCAATGQPSTGARGEVGPIQAPGHVDVDITSRAVDFSGSCAWARAPGAATRYQVPVQVMSAPGGSVSVRSDAGFDPVREDNIIGQLSSGSSCLAEGPLSDPTTGRTGYAILVRGVSGRICRGYVSATSVARQDRPDGP